MESNSTKPTIVVDLDETLVHVTPIVPNYMNKNNYFRIIIKKRKFYVQMRPYLQTFLDRLSNFYEICVFTASEKDYANKIIDKILPNVKNCFRFFRDSCVNCAGYFVKDLNAINCPIKQTLLIDDIAGSALNNPKNLVKIRPWNGEEGDEILNQLASILEKIAFDVDLRKSFIEIIKNGNFDGIGTF